MEQSIRSAHATRDIHMHGLDLTLNLTKQPNAYNSMTKGPFQEPPSPLPLMRVQSAKAFEKVFTR